MRSARFLPVLAAALLLASSARAMPTEVVVPIGYEEALRRARAAAPDLLVARAKEGVARAEVGVAGTYANPTLYAGTSTQAARFSAGASIPLVVLGQRGVAMDASRAELATALIDTQITWNDVRAATATAYVALWLAEQDALAKAEAAAIVSKLDRVVHERIELGAAPEVEGLRVRAERLRAAADADVATTLVGSSAAELGLWIGRADGSPLRAKDAPTVPRSPETLGALLARVGEAPAVRRERSDARAADARADHERALVRPAMVLDLGVDALDPSLNGTNYRGQLGVEVPLFNQRGAYIDREIAAAHTARSREAAARSRMAAELVVAYRSFEVASTRLTALEEGVVPAADAAASATEEAYTLGRAPLIAVLDAEKAKIEARLSLIDARADRATAWIEVEHVEGTP